MVQTDVLHTKPEAVARKCLRATVYGFCTYVLSLAVYSPRSRIELDSNNHTLIAHTYTVHRTVNSNQLGHPGAKTTTVITIIIKN